VAGLVLAGSVLVVGCGGGADHETLGDRAYLDRDYSKALVEYQLESVQGGSNSRIRAKTARAAFHAGQLETAAEEYRALAALDRNRSGEAADGLELVARAAIEDGDRAGLRAAIDALSAVAEERAISSFALQIARELDLDRDTAAALAVLPHAAAAAPSASLQDSLMFVYAQFLVRIGRCGSAVPALEGIIRRGREAEVMGPARFHLSRCAWLEGRRALTGGKPREAEEWFTRAVVGGFDNEYARASYIGLGDVRFAQGDYVEAAEAYQQATVGAEPGDSLAQIAAQKLNDLADAGTVIPR
jgi:tetratricopeptide (TPR) repeat protein